VRDDPNKAIGAGDFRMVFPEPTKGNPYFWLLGVFVHFAVWSTF